MAPALAHLRVKVRHPRDVCAHQVGVRQGATQQGLLRIWSTFREGTRHGWRGDPAGPPVMRDRYLAVASKAASEAVRPKGRPSRASCGASRSGGMAAGGVTRELVRRVSRRPIDLGKETLCTGVGHSDSGKCCASLLASAALCPRGTDWMHIAGCVALRLSCHPRFAKSCWWIMRHPTLTLRTPKAPSNSGQATTLTATGMEGGVP